MWICITCWKTQRYMSSSKRAFDQRTPMTSFSIISKPEVTWQCECYHISLTIFLKPKLSLKTKLSLKCSLFRIRLLDKYNTVFSLNEPVQKLINNANLFVQGAFYDGEKNYSKTTLRKQGECLEATSEMTRTNYFPLLVEDACKPSWPSPSLRIMSTKPFQFW